MAASAEALLLCVAVARDAAASSVAEGLRQKAAVGSAELMEETTRVLTIIEPMRLTRIELTDLLIRIINALPTCRKARRTGKSRS
jgi:hypothetical protein